MSGFLFWTFVVLVNYTSISFTPPTLVGLLCLGGLLLSGRSDMDLSSLSPVCYVLTNAVLSPVASSGLYFNVPSRHGHMFLVPFPAWCSPFECRCFWGAPVFLAWDPGRRSCAVEPGFGCRALSG